MLPYRVAVKQVYYRFIADRASLSKHRLAVPMNEFARWIHLHCSVAEHLAKMCDSSSPTRSWEESILQRYVSRAGLCLLAFPCLGLAEGADILVAPTGSPGTTLSAALQNAMPGDILLLEPGVHAGGQFRAGLTDVTIRSSDPNNRAIIRGGTNNIQLSDASNVTIEQLVFEDGAGNGINIDDGGSFATPSTNITLRDITVQDVGSGGNNDGIKLSGVTGFVIDGVRVFNWGAGGSAIDPVGSHDGLIQNSHFRHTNGGGSVSGVRPKGGSKNITIRANRFEITNGAGRAIQFGGNTGAPFFRFIDGDSGYEADSMIAEGNVIVRAGSAANWVNIDGGIYHHNFIERPNSWTMRILNENRGIGIVDSQNGQFSDNRVVFNDTATEYSQAVNIGPENLPETFTFSGNQWYNLADPTVAGSTPNLPAEETGGIYGVDPGDDTGVKAWQFDWGLWLVNANETAGVFPLNNPQQFLQATSTGGDFSTLDANPFAGSWDYTSLPGGQLQLEPFSQLILTTGIGTGDADGDGDADAADFVSWQRGFGLLLNAEPSDGDFDNNNLVDTADLQVWKRTFGQLSGAAATLQTPEPATWVICAGAALGMTMFCRRFPVEKPKFSPENG